MTPAITDLTREQALTRLAEFAVFAPQTSGVQLQVFNLTRDAFDAIEGDETHYPPTAAHHHEFWSKRQTLHDGDYTGGACQTAPVALVVYTAEAPVREAVA